MRKTCPRCSHRSRNGASRCRRCGYRYPEKSGPRPAGLAMGVGFPLFLVGTLILLTDTIPTTWAIASTLMVLFGAVLFLDPR
jgi:hypothetical protein